MPEDTMPIDRPTVVFNDEDGPGALVAQPETPASGNGAAESAAAVLVASSIPGVAAEPGPAGEAAMADASAAAASVVETSGGAAAGGAVASAAVSAKGGGAQSAGAAFQLSEEVGLAVATYQRGKSRPADPKLLKLFVTDDHLISLWSEIGRVELEVVELSKASPRMVRELIDRLSVARNLLLSDRDQYEDVLRELNIVKNIILRVRHSNRAQQPFTIQIFLYAVVAVVALLFIQGPSIAELLGNRVDVLGIPTQVLWNSLLWGGIGGLSAAFYALLKHVEDYDPQHARWYYLSPVIGLVFGPLVALLADVGLPALVQLVGTAPSEMEVRPAVMYLLAWAVGFQQQLVIYLLKAVVGRIVPGMNVEKQEEAAKG
jgi:hypothetical protein